MDTMAGKAAQTSSEMPAKIRCLRPVAAWECRYEFRKRRTPHAVACRRGTMIGSISAMTALSTATTLCFSSPVERAFRRDGDN
jgi:hypothetical protein